MSDDRDKLLKIMSSLESDYKSGKISREKYNYYMSHFDEVEAMLQEGAAKARPVAQRTLKRLKEAVFGR